jgi:hypothetical protein
VGLEMKTIYFRKIKMPYFQNVLFSALGLRRENENISFSPKTKMFYFRRPI